MMTFAGVNESSGSGQAKAAPSRFLLVCRLHEVIAFAIPVLGPSVEPATKRTTENYLQHQSSPDAAATALALSQVRSRGDP